MQVNEIKVVLPLTYIKNVRNINTSLNDAQTGEVKTHAHVLGDFHSFPAV